ncbi:MAG TPA: MFS transporter [Streptosporangiaceae bacterium]|nr:MFS transporter [Streptosporangiaceae bacterium]
MDKRAAAAPEATSTGRRRGGLLWHRNFRLLWIGETVNQLGSAMAVVGVPLLAVLVLHASTFEVAALTAAAYLPWLVIGLPAGAWVDRLPCRPVMIVCDLISAALFASIPVAAWLGVLTIGQVLAVQLIAGAANVMFMTAYQVNLPSLVTAGELVEGNAKMQGSAAAAQFGGNALGGIAAQAVGAATALLFNAASFLVSAACVLAIQAQVPRQAAPRKVTTLRREVAAGVALVARDRYLRPLAMFGGIGNFALDGFAALAVVFLVRDVGLGAAAVGLLMAVPGIAIVIGAAVARKFSTKAGSARTLLLSTLCTAPFALLVPLTGPGPRLAFYVVGVLVTAMGVGVSNVIIATFRQSYCPAGMIGRVTATMRFVAFGATPVGALVAGALGTALGIRSAMWIMLSVLVLSGTVLLTPAFIRSRSLPAGRMAAGPTQVAA